MLVWSLTGCSRVGQIQVYLDLGPECPDAGALDGQTVSIVDDNGKRVGDKAQWDSLRRSPISCGVSATFYNVPDQDHYGLRYGNGANIPYRVLKFNDAESRDTSAELTDDSVGKVYEVTVKNVLPDEQQYG